MSVYDVVLFVSTTSRACIPAVKFIQQNGLPVRFVRLDTVEDRRAASQGKYFQIHVVPTLLVTYDDQTVQLFTGQEKVIAWLKQVIKSQKSPTPPLPSSSDDDEEDYTPVEPSPPKKKKKKKPPPVQFEESSDEEEYEILDHPVEPPQPSRNSTEGLEVGPKASMKKVSQMSSISEIAKQMEKERQSTLGYREEDLPKT